MQLKSQSWADIRQALQLSLSHVKGFAHTNTHTHTHTQINMLGKKAFFSFWDMATGRLQENNTATNKVAHLPAYCSPLKTRTLDTHMQHIQTAAANLKHNLNPSFILHPISPPLLQPPSLSLSLCVSLFILCWRIYFIWLLEMGLLPQCLCVCVCVCVCREATYFICSRMFFLMQNL